MDKYFEIVKRFLNVVAHSDISIKPINTGLINDTFKVCYGREVYVLQKLNQEVFKTPQVIQDNYNLVKRHLAKAHYPKETLNFLKADTAKDLLNINGEFWRMSQWIQGDSFQSCPNTIIAKAAGKALAEFHWYLKDVDPNTITNPIPKFCDFEFRMVEYEKAIKYGDTERIKRAEGLISEINSSQHFIDKYLEAESKLPKRIIHGDPKISNFLFVQGGQKVEAIIDIDTIMSGTILYDFGDMVRSFANTKVEDSLDKTDSFNSLAYESLRDRCLSIAQQFLMTDEQEKLPLSSICISLIQSIRFLTDYLT